MPRFFGIFNNQIIADEKNKIYGGPAGWPVPSFLPSARLTPERLLLKSVARWVSVKRLFRNETATPERKKYGGLGQSLKGEDVVAVMNQLKVVNLSVPGRLQVDNGSERSAVAVYFESVSPLVV